MFFSCNWIVKVNVLFFKCFLFLFRDIICKNMKHSLFDTHINSLSLSLTYTFTKRTYTLTNTHIHTQSHTNTHSVYLSLFLFPTPSPTLNLQISHTHIHTYWFSMCVWVSKTMIPNLGSAVHWVIFRWCQGYRQLLQFPDLNTNQTC